MELVEDEVEDVLDDDGMGAPEDEVVELDDPVELEVEELEVEEPEVEELDPDGVPPEVLVDEGEPLPPTGEPEPPPLLQLARAIKNATSSI